MTMITPLIVLIVVVSCGGPVSHLYFLTSGQPNLERQVCWKLCHIGWSLVRRQFSPSNADLFEVRIR